MIQLKRVHDAPSPEDGFRVLVERFWPRDLDKKHAKIDLWFEDIAPSAELRARFSHEPMSQKWAEFQDSYWSELKQKHHAVKLLHEKAREGTLTLVHAAHDHDHNAAVVLKRFLEETGSTPATSASKEA
jgi:uncharacterized protein YeaO (DUF488 family)